MINRLWTGLLILLLLSGCGYDGSASRQNDFVPLTSIVITSDSATIANGTSTKLKVTGNFSGLFTRDVTDQAVWSSNNFAEFRYNTAPNKSRVTGIAPGTAVLSANIGGITADFSLTVSSAKVNPTLTITPATSTVPNGLTTQFTASGTFDDGTTQDLTFDSTWSPTTGTIATVSNDPASKGLAKAVASAGTETITATFDGASGSAQLTASEPLLQSITVLPANQSVLSLSTTDSFAADGLYSDGVTRPITNLVSWSSDSPTIATIAATGGAATTLAQGTTLIRASISAVASTGQTAVSGTASLKVTGGTLTGIAVTPAPVTLKTANLIRMKAIGSFSTGTTTVTRDITGIPGLWTITDTALATVVHPSGNLVWLNALAVDGATTVTAKSGAQSVSTNLTTHSHALSSVTIFPTAGLNIASGTSARFTVTGSFSGGETQDVTANCTWATGDSAIATVENTTGFNNQAGRVRGVATGTTTISATCGSLPAITAPVTVTARPLVTLTITPASTSAVAGNQISFTATAGYSGFVQDVTEDTVWTIDNPAIANFADSTNQPGQVVGIDSGKATITASFGGLTPTVALTISAP